MTVFGLAEAFCFLEKTEDFSSKKKEFGLDSSCSTPVKSGFRALRMNFSDGKCLNP